MNVIFICYAVNNVHKISMDNGIALTSAKNIQFSRIKQSRCNFC
jgi:uncharacterized metal-binding protein